MKKITLSADEQLIDEARTKAREQNTTLSAQFRLWLVEYASGRAQAARALRTIDAMRKTTQLRGPFTRDEMNER